MEQQGEVWSYIFHLLREKVIDKDVPPVFMRGLTVQEWADFHSFLLDLQRDTLRVYGLKIGQVDGLDWLECE